MWRKLLNTPVIHLIHHKKTFVAWFQLTQNSLNHPILIDVEWGLLTSTRIENRRDCHMFPKRFKQHINLSLHWWPWFPSRSSVLIYMYIYMCMYIPYTSSVIGRIYNGIVIQYWQSCTPSRSIGLFLGSARFLGWMPLFVFFSLPIVSCSLIKKYNTRMLVTFGICFNQHFDTRYLVFYNTSPARMFLSLDLLWEYRIQHGANGPHLCHI